MLRWLGKNLGSLLLALTLAIFVWVSAVLSTDPNKEAILAYPISLELVGQDATLLQTAALPEQVRLTINAPNSIWERLNANPAYVRAWIDLTGLGPGEHLLTVITQVSISPADVVSAEPSEVQVVLEPLVSQTMRLEVNVSGEPALGYRKGSMILDPNQVTVSGPESLVKRVSEVRASLDISGANDTIRKSVPIQAVDDKSAIVQGITVSPAVVSITHPVSLQGGYRNVVVKVVTVGQVAEGYWLTNVSVTPPNVILFSSNPSLVNNLPGFVETLPLDLDGLQDDVDIRAALDLAEGITLAGEESVLVRLSIAALEGSLPFSLPLEVIGLPPEYSIQVSPEVVDLLLTGPMPILNNLNPAGIRISINVTGLAPGLYQLKPVVDLLPSQVSVSSILPEEVQVLIEVAPTPTPGLPLQTTPQPTSTTFLLPTSTLLP